LVALLLALQGFLVDGKKGDTSVLPGRLNYSKEIIQTAGRLSTSWALTLAGAPRLSGDLRSLFDQI
jgi:hypothetical protein